MSLLEFCTLLDKSDFAVNIRESSVLFPLIEGIHLLGLGLSVGIVLVMDLRLAGLILRKRPASEIWKQLSPWMLSGFAAMFITGALLFWSHALAAYNSYAFRTKLILLALSGLNAAVYHLTVYKRMPQWDNASVPPVGARFAGFASLALWAGIITMGRIMAYSF